MLVWFTTMNPISASLVDWITASHLLQYMSLSGVMSIENIGSLFYLMMIWMLLNTWTMTMILKIWTFTFIRRFYPKRLTLHSSYSLSALAFPWNRTHDLGIASAMLYHLSYRKAENMDCHNDLENTNELQPRTDEMPPLSRNELLTNFKES